MWRNISKRHDFLHKLYRQNHLRSVEPSLELKEAYQRKSGSFMISSRILLENNRLEEAVSMAYYSMYYMVIALLFRTGIKCENHSAAAILLEQLYGIGGMHPVEQSLEERSGVGPEYPVPVSSFLDYQGRKPQVADHHAVFFKITG